MQNTFGVASFRSRQQALRLEDALRRDGVNVRIITTPRAVAMGCGLSVQFDLQDANRVRTVVQRAQPQNMIGLYRVDAGAGAARVSPMGK